MNYYPVFLLLSFLLWVHSSLVEHRLYPYLSDTVDFSPYHTSKEIFNELHTLSQSCSGMELSQTVVQNISMTWVKLKPDSLIAPASSSILLFFGEHARELISPELGLVLIRLLCASQDELQGDSKILWSQIHHLRQTSNFLIFPNVNQEARELVEKGQYCLRTNVKGVDLNRNWDEHWVRESPGDQTSGGASAFSEIETQILRDAAVEFKPTQFYTIHSGAVSMLAPYAYEPKLPLHMELVESVLETIAPHYCACPFGSAAKELGYLCPGTCLDYMYDKLNVQFAYAFEIYSPGHILPKTSKDFTLTQFLEKNKKIKQVNNNNNNNPKIRNKKMLILQQEIEEIHKISLKVPLRETVEWNCFCAFNPPDRQTYLTTLENWSRACLHAFTSVLTLQHGK